MKIMNALTLRFIDIDSGVLSVILIMTLMGQSIFTF